MDKRALPCLPVILLMAVIFSGCQTARQTVETVGSLPIAGCYRVEFLGVTENSEVTSTWRYRVFEESCEPKIGSWMLELPACATVVDASPGLWEIVSQDLNFQMSGIKWQTGGDFQSGEFSVMLTGDLEKGVARAGVAGQNVAVGSMEGPVCKIAAPSASPAAPGGPVATVKVQSANCRAKPVGRAGKIAILYRNQEAEIVGRNDDPKNPWWYVKLPEQDRSCWLWGRTSTTSGNVDGVPIVK